MHPVRSFMLFCMCACTAVCACVCVCVPAFWSGLIFISIPLPWREGWREAGVVVVVVVRRGTRGGRAEAQLALRCRSRWRYGSWILKSFTEGSIYISHGSCIARHCWRWVKRLFDTSDSATFLASNSVLGTLYSSKNSLFIQLRKRWSFFVLLPH